MDDSWSIFNQDDFLTLIERLGNIGDKYITEPKTTLAEYRRLPFYNSGHLIRIKEPSWQPKNLFIYFFQDEDEKLYWLNGTSPPIHEINKVVPIKLEDDNALEYLEFFCFFVRGEEGPFVIVNTLDDTYVPKLVEADVRAVYENTIFPAYSRGRDEEGNFSFTGTVYYSNAIFCTDFLVDPKGMITMERDEPIAADLPVKIDAPIS